MSFGGIHTKHVFPRRKRVLVGHLAALMPQSAGVLDVGCGDGSLAAGLVAERPDITIRGIDVLARQETAIPVTLFDGKRIPFDDASQDVVMFVDVLHHTHDPMVLLQEANRVSRRWIVVKDHFRDGFLANETLRFMDWVGNARYGVALPYNYWSSQQWSEGFRRLELNAAKQILKLGLYPFWADWLFGRGLHFVMLLEKQPNKA
jgi:SAM-dependent methyltransferase